ncbi:hypothetical protein RO3G_13124 [Rhizopus delemar RA 99-880]|uniref:Uncharacterized protein n=1 Tax=Rhizopus delemar (strain RA 99-880 / ATCC MYA-4621 / FGSC 9543 / NRRL 43880) TaxID=246409 RepID=I1CIY3_RHIO9|nr:hypothetical protein RO3G_13124 [Rhizopus delemar RA 99-880]|eukprot:EIE88413.1 hypothetical protein RO3G_13124 [Rhizopus delemar RA 99-880]
MFVVYNIVWIICVVLLFVSVFMLLKRRRAAQNNAPTSATTVQYYSTPQDGHTIDMNRPYHPPSTSQQPVYRPADTSAVEPPPPSYQDYAKDQRIHS